MYPVIEKIIDSTKKYYTCFEEDPALVEIKLGEQSEFSTKEYTYKIYFMSNENELRYLKTFHLREIAAPTVQINAPVLGSRMYNLQTALKFKNANLFQRSFSPEKLEGIKLSKLRFNKSSEESDRILTYLFPYRNTIKGDDDWSDYGLLRFAIQNDHPMLLQTLFDHDPSLREKHMGRGKKQIRYAIDEISPKVIPILCQNPLSKEVFEDVKETIDDVRNIPTFTNVVSSFDSSCSPAIEGGRRYKRTRRLKRTKRKTRKH